MTPGAEAFAAALALHRSAAAGRPNGVCVLTASDPGTPRRSTCWA